MWNRRELSAREDEDYFSEDDDEDIFNDEQIIKNLKKEENLCEKDEKDIITNNISQIEDIMDYKHNSNNIDFSDSADDNLAFLKQLAQYKEENITQFLRKKKLSEDDEDNEKTVIIKNLMFIFIFNKNVLYKK